MHQIEPLVDVVQRHAVGDHRIDLDLAVHVPVDDFRHIGAAARAAKGRALPDPAGDQLERAGADFRARRRHLETVCTVVPKIVDWYMEGKINIDDLITHTMPLEDINKGFELMKRGESIRGVVIY